MGKREAETGGLFGRPTMFDVGIGVLYFFTSHMVIRALYYVGIDRTPWELTVFFLTVVLAIILAHGLAGPLLQGRLLVETSFGVPAVSVLAAVGAVVALVSVLPVVGVGFFYVSGALLGFACGWIVVIWASTIRPAHPDRNSFYVDPSLLVAVAVYFLFRCVSTLSEAVGQGFLLALPLVALACIVRSDKEGGPSMVSERAQSLEVLVVVAAAFAIGCSLVVYLSGQESEMLSSGLNYMVLFEVLAVALILCCCGLLRSFAERAGGAGPKAATAVTLLLCYGPAFAVGLLMGSAGIPSHSPDALWESNMWVLVIAIFAYDIRDSPYAVRGLAVGLMFEAMCVAQLIARLSTLDLTLNSVAVAVALAALYLLCVGNQLVRGAGRQDARALDQVGRRKGSGQAAARHSADASTDAGARAAWESQGPAEEVVAGGDDASEADRKPPVREQGLSRLAWDGEAAEAGSKGATEGATLPGAASEGASLASEDEADEGVPAEIAAYCRDLAIEYGLTPREAEILALVALGRSAKYISEELTVSYNTTRTHVRHIYEKLNIHSKQELIDLVLFGSGVM